jgi:DNA repair ATPase RecN
VVTSIRHRLEQEKGKLAQIKSDRSVCIQALDTLKTEQDRIEQVSAIINTVAQATQQELEFRISDLVTMALETIPFDEHYRFLAEFVQRRGRTECDLYLLGEAGNKVRILDASGGGVANVVTFALRVSLWGLSKGIRPVLVFDEPFPFLRTREAHAKVGELLKTISERLNLQIIMITGEAESQDIVTGADKVFRIHKRGNKSTVKIDRVGA